MYFEFGIKMQIILGVPICTALYICSGECNGFADDMGMSSTAAQRASKPQSNEIRFSDRIQLTKLLRGKNLDRLRGRATILFTGFS